MSEQLPLFDERRLSPHQRLALQWRHDHAMKLLKKEPTSIDKLGLLAAVVCPGPEFLAASLAAVARQAELANENGTFGLWDTGEAAA